MGVTFERLVTGSDPRHILACSHMLVRAMPNIRAQLLWAIRSVI
jgi:hypothetical protein